MGFKNGLFGQKSRENSQLYVDLGIYSIVKARYRLREFGLSSYEVGLSVSVKDSCLGSVAPRGGAANLS